MFHHFLLLSFAGKSLTRCVRTADKADKAATQVHVKATALPGIEAAYQGLHQHRVLHGDAKPRNIMYDGGRIMPVDFKRATTIYPDLYNN